MSKVEKQKISKIIAELSLYLMMHDHEVFKLSTDYSTDLTKIEITTTKIKPSVIDDMMRKVNREREMEVETYGWQLMGDMDRSTELEIVGRLIDRMEVKNTDKETVLVLIREKFNK